MRTEPAKVDPRQDLEMLWRLAMAPARSSGELVANLSRFYHEVYERDLSRYGGADVAPDAPALMSELFQIRSALRDRIPEWQSQGILNREAQKCLRDVLRVTRYATDMLGELCEGFEFGTEDDPPRRAFREFGLNAFVNPRFYNGRDIPFRTGDVLLVRGRLHNSAAIARIGDMDSQFSHAALVHVDERGRAWVVEALIEKGAVVMPLAEVLDQGLARALLFRHPDAGIAAKAAKLIHDHVRRSQLPENKRILYDFSMRLTGYDRLYCSKLVRLAYEDATGGALRLPTFTTRLDSKNRDFFRRIGVKAEETFAPGDLEIEPTFDLIAEWQDYRYTAQTRLQDLIMSKLFDWMDDYGYRFEEDLLVHMIAILGRLSTRLSERARAFVSSVVPEVPPNMSRRAIAAIAMLHRTAQPILEELQHLDRVTVATSGRTLHPREVNDYLEDLRRRSHGRLGYLVAPRKLRV